MKIDNHIGEGFDAAPLRAENEYGLAILDQPPRCRQAEFALIVGKEARATALRRYPVRRGLPCEEALYPGAFIADAEVQSSCGRCPYHFAEPQAGWPPIVLDQSAGVISSQPAREVVELIAIWQDR